MTATSSTYLRLFEADGNWIHRPGYMILAALSDPDPKVIEHIYLSMLNEDLLNPDANEDGLTRFGAEIKKQYIDKFVKHRVLTGTVICELCRLAAATGKPPKLNAAYRLVAFNSMKERDFASEDTAIREVKKYWSKFKNTAHLQAAAVYEPGLLNDLGGKNGETLRFLGLSRAFELFFNANVVSNYVAWSPVRISPKIEMVADINFAPLSEGELEFLNLT
ncbi:MAG: hypothetical protein ACJAVM_003018 [Sulfitobacter sp.]|jgi:hypothetical protein